MVERQIITSGIELSHKGLFSIKEIQAYVRKIVEAKKYTLIENNNELIVEPHNKKHIIHLKFSKKTSQYDKSIFGVTIMFENIAKAMAIRNGHKTTCNKGKVTVSFIGTSKSHKEGFVGYTPIRYFFTYLRSKFVTKAYDKVPGEGLEDDIKDVFDDLFLYIKHTEWEEVSGDENDS